jgi:hypothetical protein
MRITEIGSLSIQARMALIVGANTFDRLFAGIQFEETDGPDVCYRKVRRPRSGYRRQLFTSHRDRRVEDIGPGG